MKITDVQITPIKPRDGLVAFANVVIDDSIHMGFIGVHTKLDGSGYRITYPTKKAGVKGLNIFYPLNKETSKLIEEAILFKANQILTS
ncbi:MAG: septation protein SpoVG family protein [Candidatus Staskawiczbacteria bacterium]|nr:septation protein SpoVG family protein [Candidatus Staskawiczbacteria bacterium]